MAPTDSILPHTIQSPRLLHPADEPLKGLKPDACLSWWRSAKPPPFRLCCEHYLSQHVGDTGAAIAHHDMMANLPALCSAHKRCGHKLEECSICMCLLLVLPELQPWLPRDIKWSRRG